MVSVCLPSDALLQHLPSYLGFSYLGCWVSLHSCSSKAQPLLLTLDKRYLLTTALPDLQRGIGSLGPPALAQPGLLGRVVGPPGHRPWPRAWGRGVALPVLISLNYFFLLILWKFLFVCLECFLIQLSRATSWNFSTGESECSKELNSHIFRLSMFECMNMDKDNIRNLLTLGLKCL